MELEKIVKQWFNKWETGDYLNLPIAENFVHTSPYGVINKKVNYLNLVKSNEEKFLGYKFEIQDELYLANKACVRYTASKGTFKLDVSEWYYMKNGLIEEIIAYYDVIGEFDLKESNKL